MLKVRILSSVPWSLTFGGVESKALIHKNVSSQAGRTSVDVDFIDFHNPYDRPDILHIFGASIATARAGIFAADLGIKVITNPIWLKPEPTILHKLGNKLFKRLPVPNTYSLVNDLLHSSTTIVCNCHEELQQITDIFEIQKSKTTIIPNGINRQQFYRSPPDINVLKKLVGADAAKRGYFLSVSFMDPRKNTLRLIEAYSRLKTDKKLILVGGFRNAHAEFKKKVLERIANSGNIAILPKINDKEALRILYSGAVAHLLPSILEAPGNSSLEALACGTPVLVGDRPATREYFGNDAEYCDPRSVQSISSAILSLEKKTRNSYGRNLLSWEDVTEKYIDLYRSRGIN
ncbi:glycosyltransferase [Planktomarina temperata]|nr:glycosyltransferase [Planktomarina temperata]